MFVLLNNDEKYNTGTLGEDLWIRFKTKFKGTQSYNFKKTKAGGLVVMATDKCTTERLLELELELAKLRKPMIIIKDTPSYYDKENVLIAIHDQKPNIRRILSNKLAYKLELKKPDCVNWTANIAPAEYKKIIDGK